VFLTWALMVDLPGIEPAAENAASEYADRRGATS